MIKGMNHVGISVPDLEKSMKFYRDVLEMEVVHGGESFEGERFDKILALKGAKFRAARLKKGNLQLELFEFSHPAPSPQDPSYPVSDHGIFHFCVEVTDLDGMHERLRAAGVAFHCPPLTFSEKVKATYGRDPDGNVFELVELSGS